MERGTIDVGGFGLNRVSGPADGDVRVAFASAIEAAGRVLGEMESAREGFDSDLGELRSQRDRLRETLERVARDSRAVLEEAEHLAASTLQSLQDIRTRAAADGGVRDGAPAGGADSRSKRELDRERETTRSQREEIEDLTHRLRLAEARIRDLESQCQAKDRRLREFERALDPR